MILAIDIGNTQTTIGAIDGGQVVHDWRLSTRTPRTRDELALTLRGFFDLDGVDVERIDSAVIGSVVAHLTPVFEAAGERVLGRRPLVVNGHTPMPIENGYENPDDVGVDRLANAVAGVSRFGKPLVVVDFGTAITLDVISADAVYLGGVILPAPEMMADALTQGTSRLPRVVVRPPAGVVGRTTADSIASGLFHGTAGAVDTLVRRVCGEIGVEPAWAVATGGRSEAFWDACETLTRRQPFLTLYGLEEICRHNR